jgi:hypothetical protein
MFSLLDSSGGAAFLAALGRMDEPEVDRATLKKNGPGFKPFGDPPFDRGRRVGYG